MFTASVPQDRVDEYVAQEQLRASEELAEFLKEHGLKDSKWSLHVEEGEPFQAISRMVTEMYPDLLLIGTHSRSGIAKVLLGSVAEQALRELDVDILAVPPAAARV
jgi:nucleotide-binding universal stress UspA family protein